MQKNPITYPTGGQAVANDGLLAGRELESDAELIALGWLKPTDLFEGDELPAIYPEDDAQERADQLTKLESQRKAERDAWLASFPEDRTAFEMAADFGRIGSKPKSTLCKKTPIIDRTPPGDSPTVDNRDILPMLKPESLYCVNFGQSWQVAFFPDGQQQVRHFECSKCVNCVEWRKEEIAHRYALVRNEWQTVITVGGFANPDTASKWSDAQSDRAGGQRHRMMRWDVEAQTWQLVITHNRILDGHTIELTERDIARKQLAGNVEVCSLSPMEFKAMLPNETTHTGPSGKKRHSSHFTKWPAYVDTPNTYATSDPTYFVNDSNAPEPTELTPLEKERASMDVETQADLWAADWWVDTDPINRGTFDDALLRVDELDADHELIIAVKEQSRYAGPTALLIDAMEYQANAEVVPWRDAYRHVLDAVGLRSPDPHCRQCGQQTRALTWLYLCAKCELRRD